MTQQHAPRPAMTHVAQSAFELNTAQSSSAGVAKAAHAMVAPAADAITCMEKEREMEEHQRLFAANRQVLVKAIEESTNVVEELRSFSNDRWILHYPEALERSSGSQLRRSQSTMAGQSITDLEAAAAAVVTPRPAGMQRNHTTSVAASAPSTPLRARVAAAPRLAEQCDETAVNANQLSVLKVDVKVGAAGPSGLVHSLEKSAIAQLLDRKMAESQRQLNNLKTRIADKQSKVLVTGDLNAGKSTFVNALMRRRVMPTDQQPCTTVFCEVLDAAEFNEGREEVHMLKHGVVYDRANESTYTLHSLDEIEKIESDAEEMSPEDAPIVKMYCNDARLPNDSLLRNGVVDIALIDAPGLNRDSLKTTALFARQEEIDVVVFVVSAENHFTLSAKEFLWNASNDKAYVFIVVNKYDQIKNKEKCRRLVLDQIKTLSPSTYEDAEDLVHFVDSSVVFAAADDESKEVETPGEERKVGGGDITALRVKATSDPAFAQLEASLRDFVLLKRSKSKLMPAQTYLLRLLFDVDFLARTNVTVAAADLADARDKLAVARPALAESQRANAKLTAQLEGEEDGVVSGVVQGARESLEHALASVGAGRSAHADVALPEWQGYARVFDYASEVRQALLASLEASVRSVEDAARAATSEAVERIRKLGDQHLPVEAEKSQRIFLPEAMFAARRRKASTGIVGLGHGAELVEMRITDLVDLPHYVQLIARRGSSSGKDKAAAEHDANINSSLTVGLGALTLVGGQTLGARTVIEAVVRVSDLLGNKTARRWAGPVFALASAGLVVYFITDLPNAIPRNAGRSIRRELEAPRAASFAALAAGQATSTTVVPYDATVEASSSSAAVAVPASAAVVQSEGFVGANVTRTSRETRKVLRLVGWEIQELFRAYIAACKADVERAEAREKRADGALEHFDAMRLRAKRIAQDVSHVALK